LKLAEAMQFASDIGVYVVIRECLGIDPTIARLFARFMRALGKLQVKEPTEAHLARVDKELVHVLAELESRLLTR
jgi:hypothetical protein